MQINISGHHFDLTPAVKDHVSHKFSRLSRHNDKITSTNVILTLDKLIHKVEATIHISGKDLFANSEAEDLYIAIDLLTDKLDRQLIKYKEKQRSNR